MFFFLGFNPTCSCFFPALSLAYFRQQHVETSLGKASNFANDILVCIKFDISFPFLHRYETFLSVWPNLRAGPCPNEILYFSPIFSKQTYSLQESLVLFIFPSSFNHRTPLWFLFSRKLAIRWASSFNLPLLFHKISGHNCMLLFYIIIAILYIFNGVLFFYRKSFFILRLFQSLFRNDLLRARYKHPCSEIRSVGMVAQANGVFFFFLSFTVLSLHRRWFIRYRNLWLRF